MYLDIVVAGLLFLMILFGLKNGFFVEFFSIFGIVINFIIAKKITPMIIQQVGITNDNNNYISVYMGTFWALYLILGIFIYIISAFLKSQGKSIINRILGGILGIFKGSIVVVVLLVAFNFMASKYPNLETYSKGSYINKIFLENVSYLEEYVTKEFKDKLREIKDNELINRYFNKIL